MAKPKFITDKAELEKLAPMILAPIKRHVLVCNGKSCSAVGSADVKAEFVRILEAKGLRQGKASKGRNPMGEVLLTDCGSIGFCSLGTAVMVYPDGTMYGQVQPEDVREIVEEHLEKGEVVERLALLSLRSNKLSPTVMSIEEYLSLLENLLGKHPHGRVQGTNIYVGPPFQDVCSSILKKHFFVHLLCMSVAFDLTVTYTFGSVAGRVKDLFRFPTFEYGLSSGFYHPEELFEHFKIPFDRAILEVSHILFGEYVARELSAANIDLDMLEMKRRLATDPQLNRGIWGSQYCDILAREIPDF
ncbi:MAG: (2Fe-2S) ferredoxin domain-containing protein [Pyrinomonadaceae bacterium]